MGLDPKTKLLVQLSAAIASNALVSIRQTFTDAQAQGISLDDIQETIKAALEIQQQPISHSEHLVQQLIRDITKGKSDSHALKNNPAHDHPHDHKHKNCHGHHKGHHHSGSCGCGCHKN